MKFNVSLLLLGLLLTGRLAVAQRIAISGQVVEAATGEPVPFASIFVPRTNIGVTADLDGKFKLAVDGADSLAASSLGFLTLRKKLTSASPQTVLFRLKKGGGVALGEVFVS
ncbi:MAG: carboxypeptidase-like regulatory domain-containing protein, partial [Hymenobacter sp.]